MSECLSIFTETSAVMLLLLKTLRVRMLSVCIQQRYGCKTFWATWFTERTTCSYMTRNRFTGWWSRMYCTLGTSIATSLMALGFTAVMAHWRSCRVTVTVPISCWSDAWWEAPNARLSACRPGQKGLQLLNREALTESLDILLMSKTKNKSHCGL